MIYRSMTLKGCAIPNLKLNGIIKYLGHYITNDLSDDEDVNIVFMGILYRESLICVHWV